MAQYSLRHVGHKNSLAYRIYFEKNNIPCSPFHDIPLVANNKNKTFNMVVEVPRWSNAKMEIDTGAFMNPIKQDVKKGKLRFVHNIYPHKGYIMNYGYFPQTWEDPMTVDHRTGEKGDNDPIDVCEIGDVVSYPGQVKEVKVLGVIALLDEGETDWKIIAIDVNDPLAAQMNDIEDVENVLPGRLAAITEWFRVYKMPDGKDPNVFAFDGKGTPKDKQYATDVINECHAAWQKLIYGTVARKSERYDLAVENVYVDESPYKISTEDAKLKEVPTADPKPDHAIPESVHKWHNVHGAFKIQNEQLLQ